jgi:hypothetical protein
LTFWSTVTSRARRAGAAPLYDLNTQSKSGVARNTACHRTPNCFVAQNVRIAYNMEDARCFFRWINERNISWLHAQHVTEQRQSAAQSATAAARSAARSATPAAATRRSSVPPVKARDAYNEQELDSPHA